MIKAVFYKEKNGFRSYDISGHSGYDKKGKDIVCASVSVLCLHTTKILMEEFEVIKSFHQDEEGRLSVELSCMEDISQMLIRKLVKTLTEIQKEYSGYLLVEVKE